MKLTVAVLAYNQVQFVRQALDSVLAQQTEFDFDIVISEDCSTDGTREIVREYAAEHPNKIHLLMSTFNAGDFRVIEELYKSARGAYIALLEGDDYWTSPHKLQKQVEFMEENQQYSICWHYQEHVDSQGLRMPDQVAHSSKLSWSVEDILQHYPIQTSSVVLRRSMLPALPDWLNKCPFRDYPIFVLCMQNGPGGYLDESLGAYRIHAQGFSSCLDDVTLKLLCQRTYKQIYLHLAPVQQVLVAKLFARKWASVAMLQSLSGDLAACRETAREGLADFPNDVRLRLLAHFPSLYVPLRSMWLRWKHLFGRRVQDEA